MHPAHLGHHRVVLPETTSTNTYATELLHLGEAVHGTVVVAREQTAGRGQRGRSWVSGAGEDLTASLVLLPQRLVAQDQYVINRLVTLAMVDVLAPLLDKPVRIKWPNDIVVEHRKIAGILIKTELAGSLVQSAVVGIGLNVNSLGHDPAFMATSLRQESGGLHDPDQLLDSICQAMERRNVHWEQGHVDATADFTGKLWSRGRWAHFLLDGKDFTARPLDVDAMGRLLVEDEQGTVAAYGTDRLQLLRR
jgi:BirA family biotin operon repressor/biotin-[acetyl-CoA-carboxylase] ligase